MTAPCFRGFRFRGFLFLGLLASASALALPPGTQTQPPKAPAAAAAGVITIRMYDGRTAHQITPSNFLIRFDHQEEVHNESLHIDDEGTGQITVPAGTAFLSVEGSYDNSMEIYLNCDSDMEKSDRRRHWYPIADILSTGVTAPNECFNGKYERPRLPVKPGEFIFYVRQHNWHEMSSY